MKKIGYVRHPRLLFSLKKVDFILGLVMKAALLQKVQCAQIWAYCVGLQGPRNMTMTCSTGCYIFYVKLTYLTQSDGWKAAGLSCWENLGRDPCKIASRTASNIPSCNKKPIFTERAANKITGNIMTCNTLQLALENLVGRTINRLV